eukprot:TRINITY_DN3179_c0_g1_i2.p1 TRINITY_DN3179_c0_g1~~TRINITY_DN3179_c0_g1_i2.p1  ORF type:complete len:258 (+),score=39.32 TRINITY_DN3179_c0_g1_i2:861-1634(+)
MHKHLIQTTSPIASRFSLRQNRLGRKTNRIQYTTTTKTNNIDVYYDVISPWSYFALKVFDRYSKAGYPIQVNAIPVLNVEIFKRVESAPPIRHPVKGQYLRRDAVVCAEYYNIPQFEIPKFFPFPTVDTMRVLCAVHEKDGSEKGREVALNMFNMLFGEAKNISKDHIIREGLSVSGYNKPQIKSIMDAAKSEEISNKLNSNIDELLERGGFGTPTFFTKLNGQTQEEMYFGADRIHMLFDTLNIEWQKGEPKPYNH